MKVITTIDIIVHGLSYLRIKPGIWKISKFKAKLRKILTSAHLYVDPKIKTSVYSRSHIDRTKGLPRRPNACKK